MESRWIVSGRSLSSFAACLPPDVFDETASFASAALEVVASLASDALLATPCAASLLTSAAFWPTAAATTGAESTTGFVPGTTASGDAKVVVAGGMESMTRAPHLLMGSRDGWTYGSVEVLDHMAFDGLTDPYEGKAMGVFGDAAVAKYGFTRDDCDAYAVESQKRSAKSWEAGLFKDSVVPVRDVNGLTLLDRDEHMRPSTDMQSLGQLKASFVQMGQMGGFDAVAIDAHPDVEAVDHVHHAGNSSGIVDGAALTLIGSEEAGRRAGMSPRARIVSAAVVGSEPTIMLTGPTPACRKALEVAGMTAADIDLVEINEAFAAVPLLLMKEMGWTEEQTNVNGGAIAMGHPLGATGAMILGTLVDELERRDLRTGIATLCIGAGMGVATIVERV